jgi:type IV secretion system protein VirB10
MSEPAEEPGAPPPKLPPESVELRAVPRPAMRLNRRTLVVGAGVVSFTVLGATIWSLQPRSRPTGAGEELYNVDRISQAEGLQTLPRDYSQVPPPAPPVLGEPLPGDLGRPIVRAEQEAGLRPAGPTAADAERQARAKEAADAARAPLFYKSSNRGGSPAGPAPADAAAVPASLPGDSPPIDAIQTQNMQDDKIAFASRGQSKTRSAHRLETPREPNTLMAGTVIAAALVTGIKTDLPGDIIATVTEPVYDSATHRNVLIPQGATLMGRHNSHVAYGQSRAQAVWDRIIMPDTSSVVLDNLAATDAAGYAGLEDEVDWHWGRILGGAALTTLLGVGAELAAPQNQGSGDGRVIIATRDGVQDTVNQVGQEITRRNMNIQPTLTIRPGMPLHVVVNRDITLRPYRPLFINR